MNVNSMTVAEKESLYRKGIRWLACVHYTSRADETKGDVVSCHKTYGAAAKASRSSHVSIKDINDVWPIDETCCD